MNGFLDIFRAVAKGGFRTSEFWLAVLAMFIPLIDSAVQHLQGTIANAQATPHSALVTLGYAIAAAVVASVYAVVRGKLKGDTANAASLASAVAGAQSGTIPLPTGGNVLNPPDGH